MDAYIVELKNQPGTFGRVAGAIAARGVNVICAGAAFADFGMATFVSDDAEGLRAGLEECGADYRVVPALKVALENRAGAAADVSQTLSDAGINLDAFIPIEISAERCVVLIGCSDVDRARSLLGSLAFG